jgi:glycosidase
MTAVRYPLLYQINTRVWLTELGRQLQRRATLDDIPDAELQHWAELGFDWIWFLSVWQTGEASRAVSRTNGEWRHEFEFTLTDLQEEDIPGSGFAITSYTVHSDLGGNAALARLRERMRKYGLRLMLDFVPNHVALDHEWLEDHPDYFVPGTELDLARAPHNYTWVKRQQGDLLLAHGRDPYFPGWRDTIQLNYGCPEVQEALVGELLRIATQCDGVRCDMAMLVVPEIFERTWGIHSQPFWPQAIQRVREQTPEFCFMAEVYWDMEWTLQQQGFDFTYDKRLYDRLRAHNAGPVREHFLAGLDFQSRLARFLENHDEPRAAATFTSDVHEAAAALTFLSPGLRLLHQGQFEGRKIRISPHLGRAPQERRDEKLWQFYHQLLAILKTPTFKQGDWQLLTCQAGWEGNWTHHSFIVFAWQDEYAERFVIAVNFADHQSQCHVPLPFSGIGGKQWRLHDLLNATTHDWNGDDLSNRGLYLDHAPWQAAVLKLA